MAKLTDTLSTPTNQIGIYNPPADYSSEAALVQAVTPIAASIFGAVQESRTNQRLDQVSTVMEEEYQRLAEARRQGSISTPEFFTRLNSKMRTITSDFPSIAPAIRQRVQQDFGSLPGPNAFESTVDTFKQEEEANNKMYTEALTYGLGVYKDGKIDRNETIRTFTSIRRSQLMASLAGKQDTDSAAGEVDRHLLNIYNEGVGPLADKINQLQGNDAERTAAAMEEYNKYRNNYLSQVVMPTLGDSAMSTTQRKNIREEAEARMNSLRDQLFSEDSGSFRVKARQVKEMTAAGVNTFSATAPEVGVWNKMFGADATGAALSYALNRPSAPGKPTPTAMITDSISKAFTTLQTMQNTKDVLNGQVDPTTLPKDKKKEVVGSMKQIQDTLPTVSNLAEKDQLTFVSSVNNLSNVAVTGQNKQDMETQLSSLNKPSIFATMQKIATGPSADQVRQAASSNGKLSYTYLDRNRDFMLNEVKNASLTPSGTSFVKINFNPTTGRLEPVIDEAVALQEVARQAKSQPNSVSFRGEIVTPTPTLRSITVPAISKANQAIKPFNDALDVFSQSAKLQGYTKYSDQQLKQYAVDTYGYETNPLLRKQEVGMDMDRLVPTLPSMVPNVAQPQTNAPAGRTVILNSDGTFSYE